MRVLLTLLSNEVLSRIKLLVLALLLASLELFIPRLPFAPWLKPGLANAVAIVWMYRYGAKDALLFGLLRIWILSIFFGFSFFTVSLSFSGMLFSICGMWIVMQLVQKRILGLFSVGVTGAMLHNMGQLLLVQPLLGEVFSLRSQLVMMFCSSLLFGAFTSYVGFLLLEKRRWPKEVTLKIVGRETSDKSVSKKNCFFSFTLFAFALSLFYVKDLALVFSCGGGVYCAAVIVEKSFVTPLRPIRRSWLFLLCIFLSFFPIDTSERCWLAATQVFKIGTWLTMTSIFKVVQFDRVIFSVLRKLFRSSAYTLDAGVLVVEIFPAILDTSGLVKRVLLKRKGKGFLTVLTHEVDLLVKDELSDTASNELG